MKYLAVLGRQPEISKAEILAQFPEVEFVFVGKDAVIFETEKEVRISRFGGMLKVGVLISERPLEFLKRLPEGKITLGVSDYSGGASRRSAAEMALKLKKILVRHGRSVRVVENKAATLSTATVLHNGLSGRNERKVEILKVNDEFYRTIGVQDIEAYARRDQARPARDAKVGMLPPKLAQILINLCGPLEPGARVLDPFCGTGVVLQEAILMGYEAYGTDISERMIEYSEKNLRWLAPDALESDIFTLSQGDATSFSWEGEIDAVACEGYLGRPMSKVPSEMVLKAEKQECSTIILGFLKNLAGQIKAGTPVVVACPAWLQENGKYSQLEILDEKVGNWYNVSNKSREGLLYHRDGQIVARDIIILRKK